MKKKLKVFKSYRHKTRKHMELVALYQAQLQLLSHVEKTLRKLVN